jgi:serine/threonine protein kinase
MIDTGLVKTNNSNQNEQRQISKGRYITLGKPRHGGISAVYKAYDTLAERTVAVKLFRDVYQQDGIIEESFRRETSALTSLKHPNIVEILDSGKDDASGQHFIVMEWIDKELESLRGSPVVESWSTFYASIGNQILEAIAFAHGHATAHRDIKPSNILLSHTGTPKLCDFGISKIRNYLMPGVTLAHFASLPYAPPEQDDGSYSYSRDVFGFVALSLSLLSDKTLRTHQDLFTSLEALDIDEKLKRLFRRCLSLDEPGERPQTASVLLAEIEQLTPRPKIEKNEIIVINLTMKVRQILQYDMNLDSSHEEEGFVEKDLENVRIMQEDSREKPDGSDPDFALSLLGSKYGYIAVRTEPTNLTLVSAYEFLPSLMERKRDEAFEPSAYFKFKGYPESSKVAIERLQQAIIGFSADFKSAQIDIRKQAIYKVWLNLLNAKTDLEAIKRKKLQYSKKEILGSLIKFYISDYPDMSGFDGLDIRIEIENEDFYGEIISVADNCITVTPNERNRIDVEALPRSGVFTIDTTKADAALDKQKAALDSVRYGRSTNPALGSYIVSPSSVQEGFLAPVDFIQKNIDEDKKEAIQVAMSGPDLLLVQGPPGTGKTTFITELVLQTLNKNPEARILLTSQTHVALDNSLERINAQTNFKVRSVRIGNDSDDRISSSSKALLVDNQLPVLRKIALAQGREFLEEWATNHGVEIGHARMAIALDRYAGLKERETVISARIQTLRPLLNPDKRNLIEPAERAELDSELDDLIKEDVALKKDLNETIAELRKYESDKDNLDLFEISTPDELRSWAETYFPNTSVAKQLRKLLLTYSDWESRFGRSREFRAALIASSQVVAGTCLGVMNIPGRNEIEYDLCIVDEASIATPTEILVPMAKAKRTILVGDSNQLSPFEDPELASHGLLAKYGLTKTDQKATLFNHLAEHLPKSLKKPLTTQHRMLPAIGDLISQCFYEKELKSVSRRPLGYLDTVLRKPVVWFSTSQLPNRSSRLVGKSTVNETEVTQVINLLNRINFTLSNSRVKQKKISVAVLSGYGVQKERLKAEIERKWRDWDSFTDIFVNVVDAFQGREADIIIFSVTRSDDRGLGFLKEMERINVALSRGKEYLAIIGDHVFCQGASSQQNPLKDVLHYINDHPDDCLLEVMAP